MLPALVALGIFISIVLVLASVASQKKKLDDTFRRVAASYNGTHLPVSFFSQPSLTFVRRGARVKLSHESSGGKNSRIYTDVHIQSRELPNVHCELRPQISTWSVLGRMFGVNDIRIGNPDFDHRYKITGSDAEGIRAMLDPSAQEYIDAIRRFFYIDDIYVRYGPHSLLIRKRRAIRDYASLRKFVDLSMKLYDHVTSFDEGAVQFIDAQQTVAFAIDTSKESLCQICGDRITSDYVMCHSCKTPHHRDCWEYHGTCSTYGCGEKRFVVPKQINSG